MKKATIFLLFVCLLTAVSITAETEATPAAEVVLKIGKVYFPKDFIHKNIPYQKGNYFVDLIKKDNAYYFVISKQADQPLLEELAVIKPNKMKKNFKYQVRKELLRGEEYFRITVINPEEKIAAYFLIKK